MRSAYKASWSSLASWLALAKMRAGVFLAVVFVKIRLVLVGIEGEANLGFIARLVANFGVEELYLVNPRVSPSDPDARRFAAKATYILDKSVVVDSLEESLEGVDVSVCTTAKAGQDSDVLRHSLAPRPLIQVLERGGYESIALVFGRESVGLTRSELALCDLVSTIPASRKYPVLNLSHAVAIYLYEFWVAREEWTPFREAAPEYLHRLRRLGETIAERVVEPQRRSQIVAAFSHCLAKAGLTKGEASALYYLFKKIVARLIQA